jgi:hypothetical protein
MTRTRAAGHGADNTATGLPTTKENEMEEIEEAEKERAKLIEKAEASIKRLEGLDIRDENSIDARDKAIALVREAHRLLTTNDVERAIAIKQAIAAAREE